MELFDSTVATKEVRSLIRKVTSGLSETLIKEGELASLAAGLPEAVTVNADGSLKFSSVKYEQFWRMLRVGTRRVPAMDLEEKVERLLASSLKDALPTLC